MTLAAWILDALLESGWKVEVGAAHTLAQAIYDPATTEKEVLLLLPVLSKMLRKDVALSKKEVESMLQPMAKAYSIRIEAEQKMGRKVYSLFCQRLLEALINAKLKPEPAVDAVPLPLVDFSLLEEEGTLASRVAAARHLLPHAVKKAFFSRCLSLSEESEKVMRLRLNRYKGRSVLEQAKAQLNAASLRSRQRPWHVTFEGEAAEDAGGPFRSSLMFMCDDVKRLLMRPLGEPPISMWMPSIPTNREDEEMLRVSRQVAGRRTAAGRHAAPRYAALHLEATGRAGTRYHRPLEHLPAV